MTQRDVPATRPVLYHYWRSSSSWRVRWALAIKGLDHESLAVDLLGGAQQSEEHLLRNSLGSVPVLRIGQTYIAQSAAIIEYLEETCPAPPLLPADPLGRARARQLAQIINADTQPLQNLSVLRHVAPGDDAAQRAWAQTWMRRGLGAYEALVRQTAGRFSYGDQLTVADLYLIPQCYNARRFGLEVELWPTVARIEQGCLATAAARDTSPEAIRQR